MTATATVPREKSATPTVPEQPDYTHLEASLVSIEQIDVGDNVREDLGDLAELVDSIREHGVLEPIRVRPAGERYQLVFGHRRLAAAKLAKHLRIPALVDSSTEAGPGQRSVQQLVENLQRRDLSDVEEARALRSILDAEKSLTQTDLAKRIGRSAPYVSNQLRILELDEKVLPLVAAGKLTGSHAKALAGLKGSGQRRMATWAVENGASAHALEEQIAYEKRQAESHAKQVEEQRGTALKAEKLLLDKGATKEQTKLAPMYYSDALLGALKGLGWKTVPHAYSRAKECDCSAFAVSGGYGGRVEVKATCITQAHFEAKKKADEAALQRRWKTEEQNRKLAEEERARLTGPLAGHVADLGPRYARLVLWVLSSNGYKARNALGAVSGQSIGYDVRADGLWTIVEALSDDQVQEATSTIIAGEILDLKPKDPLRTELVAAVEGVDPNMPDRDAPMTSVEAREPEKPKAKRSKKAASA